MSNLEVKGIYVYQPFGTVTRPDRALSGRLYGLGGLPESVSCVGLTKEEAVAFADALNGICWMMEVCPSCRYELRFSASRCPQCGTAAQPPWKADPQQADML